MNGEKMAKIAHEVLIAAQGRMVIPAHLRKEFKLKTGERLIARKQGESLVFERPETVKRRLQERFKALPTDVSLVDELIAERREAAVREGGDE